MKQCLKRLASATTLKAAEGYRVVVLHGAKRIANTAKRGAKDHVKNKMKFALAVKEAAWAHVSTYAKLHVRKTAKHRAKKVAKVLARNLANAEAVRVVAKADVKRIISAHTARIANPHVKSRHNAEAVSQAAKHHVKAAAKHHAKKVAKQERKQTQHLQHLQQSHFHLKLRAATQLSFNGERQQIAIYQDIYFKRKPTAERGHKFIKGRREASQIRSQSAQVRFSTVLRLTTAMA